MTGAVSYTSTNIIVCGNSGGYYTKLEFATQSLTSWSADTLSTVGGLPAVSFTSSLTAISEFPFSLPEISIDASPEAGLLSLGTMTLQCDNESLSGVRLYSMLRNYDTDNECMHVRFSYKQSATASWIYRYWGIVNPASLEVQCSDMNNADTYQIKFSVTNVLELLSQRSIKQFAEDKNKHQLNDYVSNYKWLTFIGTNWKNLSAGKYELQRWYFKNDLEGNSSIGWLPVGSYNGQLIPFRWFKLVDIFRKASEYLGLELDVNNGKAWSDVVTTRYGYNTASDSTTMVFTSIDKLYYQCGVYVLSNGNMIYANLYSFWDESNHAPYSFFKYSNVLELLKGLCTSLGLMASVVIDSTGKRYLQVSEAGYYDTSLSMVNQFTDNEDNFSSEISFQPYFNRTTGITVAPAFDSDVTRGTDGNDSVSVDCMFHTANHVAVIDSNNGTSWDTSANTVVTQENYRLCGSLWATEDASAGSWNNTDGSAKTLQNMYTVCAIVPKSMGITSSLSGADYDFTVKNSNVDRPYGMYVSTYGGATVNGVMYPNTDGVVNTFTEVPQMALAHYYYSPKNISKDAVGVYRSISRSLKLKATGIYPDIHIGQVLNIKVDGDYTDWFVTSIRENYTDFVTTYELESRES